MNANPGAYLHSEERSLETVQLITVLKSISFMYMSESVFPSSMDIARHRHKIADKSRSDNMSIIIYPSSVGQIFENVNV